MINRLINRNNLQLYFSASCLLTTGTTFR